jgi:hypothetical protein
MPLAPCLSWRALRFPLSASDNELGCQESTEGIQPGPRRYRHGLAPCCCDGDGICENDDKRAPDRSRQGRDPCGVVERRVVCSRPVAARPVFATLFRRPASLTLHSHASTLATDDAHVLDHQNLWPCVSLIACCFYCLPLVACVLSYLKQFNCFHRLIRIMVFRILFLRCLLPSNSPVSIRYICYHSYFCFSAEAIRAAYLLIKE